MLIATVVRLLTIYLIDYGCFSVLEPDGDVAAALRDPQARQYPGLSWSIVITSTFHRIKSWIGNHACINSAVITINWTPVVVHFLSPSACMINYKISLPSDKKKWWRLSWDDYELNCVVNIVWIEVM